VESVCGLQGFLSCVAVSIEPRHASRAGSAELCAAEQQLSLRTSRVICAVKLACGRPQASGVCPMSDLEYNALEQRLDQVCQTRGAEEPAYVS
jgi:hypothetical protein